MNITHSRNVWLDYLRSFITLLVVAHHSALAYATFSRFDSTLYIRSTAPLVDDRRWLAMDSLISFNDLFFMPLMFLISGLFVFRSLHRKGPKVYLADRFIRLGIPFILAELLIIPLAYAPSFYEATHSTDLGLFIKDYLLKQKWPVGPPWFIWLLFAFDGILVLIFKIKPSVILAIGTTLSSLSRHPVRLGVSIFGLAAIALIPLSLAIGQYTWVGNWGPFDFQLNRLFFYFLFFFMGVCLGSINWQNDFFRRGKLFGSDWKVWLLFSLTSYLLVVFVSRIGANWVKQGVLSPMEGYFLYDLAFIMSCLASISACLSFFKQTMSRSIENWTNLSTNAYWIYILHYPFVTWLQFCLLGVSLPAGLKFLLVFLGSVSLSWSISVLFRKGLSVYDRHLPESISP